MTPAYDLLIASLDLPEDKARELVDAAVREALHAPEHRARTEELVRREIRLNTEWFRQWMDREDRIHRPRIT